MLSIRIAQQQVWIGLAIMMLWLFIICSRDHELGCEEAPSFMYHKSLHLLSLFFYGGAYFIMLNEVKFIDQQTLLVMSNMGNVMLAQRRMVTLHIIRCCIITVWLFIVFFENAEETFIPVILLGIHLMTVSAVILIIIYAVRQDNRTLRDYEQMQLRSSFYFAAFTEIFISCVWLIFNIVDVTQCHQYYKG